MSMFGIIANPENQAALNELRAAEKEIKEVEDMYKNSASPLNSAQDMANNYMMLKQRVPMAIEYYRYKPQSADDDKAIARVEMYINPQRLQIQTQKVKGKAYTRGGIFYHHWGDDHWTMSLSGTVGLAGMKGIEQLETIYHHSGALLRYQNLGPDKVWVGGSEKGERVDITKPYEVIDFVFSDKSTEESINNIFDKCKEIAENIDDSNASTSQKLKSEQKLYELISKMISGYQNIIQQAKIAVESDNISQQLRDYINNNKNKSIPFEKLYKQAQSYINQSDDLSSMNEQIKVLIAFDLSKNLFQEMNKYINKSFVAGGLDYNALNALDENIFGTGLLNPNSSSDSDDTIDNLISDDISDLQESLSLTQAQVFKNYITEIRQFNENATISREKAQNGWADIRDELEDEWRPRQVFIYFEDRVYIGHFDSFSYQRQAETSLINYEMRLTITRQIMATTNDPTKKPTVTQSTGSSATNTPNGNTLNPMAIYENPTSSALVKILELKDNLIYVQQKEGISKMNDKNAEISEIESNLSYLYNSLRKSVGVDYEKDPIYGNLPTTFDDRLVYYGLYEAKVIKIGDKDYTLADAQRNVIVQRAKVELERAKKVYDKEKPASGSPRDIEIKRWADQVCAKFAHSFDSKGNPLVPNPFK